MTKYPQHPRPPKGVIIERIPNDHGDPPLTREHKESIERGERLSLAALRRFEAGEDPEPDTPKG